MNANVQNNVDDVRLELLLADDEASDEYRVAADHLENVRGVPTALDDARRRAQLVERCARVAQWRVRRALGAGCVAGGSRCPIPPPSLPNRFKTACAICLARPAIRKCSAGWGGTTSSA